MALLATGAGCRGRDALPALPDSGASDPYIGHLHWMAGSWVSVDEDTINEEHWSAPRGGMMLGMSRITVGGRVTFWEFLQIFEDGDRVILQPWPKGEDGVPFYQRDVGPGRVVFANPNNDFPQVIEYRRAGDDLEAVLSGSRREGDRRRVLRWRPSTLDR